MKYFLLVLLVSLLAGCVNSKEQVMDYNVEKLVEYNINEERVTPKARVIVGNVYNYSRFGTQRSDTIARDILISKLKKSNKFIVVDKENSTELVEKMGFLQPLSSDFSTLKQQFLNADFIIIGNILNYSLEDKNKENNIYSVELEKANTTIEFKIIDVNTGKIWSEIGKGSGRLTYSLAPKNEETVSYGVLETNANESAIENGVEKLIKEIDNLPWSATILKKDGNKLYINIHENEILKVGTEFNVYQQGNLITYKDKVLGYEENLVGVAKLVAYENSDIGILKYKGVDFLLPAVVKLK